MCNLRCKVSKRAENEFPTRLKTCPKTAGQSHARFATRCRVEDCLAVALKALTRPRIPLRVSYGGVLSW